MRLMLEDLNLKNGANWHLSSVVTRYILMIIHVYFMLYLVKRNKWLVHMPLELRHYSDTWKRHKIVFIVWILKQNDNLKTETLFHTKSNLLCLVCRSVVNVLFAPQCIFQCVSTWCVAWERQALSEAATVTTGGRSLRRVNSIKCLQFQVTSKAHSILRSLDEIMQSIVNVAIKR